MTREEINLKGLNFRVFMAIKPGETFPFKYYAHTLLPGTLYPFLPSQSHLKSLISESLGVTTVKIMNTSITPQTPMRLYHPSLKPLLPPPHNPSTTFCCCTLVCTFLEYSINGFLQQVLFFFFGLAFT